MCHVLGIQPAVLEVCKADLYSFGGIDGGAKGRMLEHLNAGDKGSHYLESSCRDSQGINTLSRASRSSGGCCNI